MWCEIIFPVSEDCLHAVYADYKEYKGKCGENNFVSKLLYKRMLLNTFPVQFMEGGTPWSSEFDTYLVLL